MGVVQEEVEKANERQQEGHGMVTGTGGGKGDTAAPSASAAPPAAPPAGDELAALLAELKLSEFDLKLRERGCEFVADVQSMTVCYETYCRYAAYHSVCVVNTDR